MCGIAGVWGQGEIDTMLSVLRHRGPDGQNNFSNGTLSFGACSLAFTARGEAYQPYTNEDQSISVLLNGEIYNYKELRRCLTGHTFATSSDTEVIAHAYEEYGMECFNLFNGCFAIVLWDGDRLVLARDRVGQKPLYYQHTDKGFFFASEIKSILSQCKDQTCVYSDSLFSFEALLFDTTLFGDIQSVSAGSCVIFNGSEPTTQRYWELPCTIDRDLSESQWKEKLRWLLIDAAEIRRPDEASGLLLSGGLDSAFLAYVMKPQYTFLCDYGQPETAFEKERAAWIATEIDAVHTVINPCAADLEEHISPMMWHLEQPIATGASISTYMLVNAAAAQVRVLLNGEGADELFGGYVRYLMLFNRFGKALPRQHMAYEPLFALYQEGATVDDLFCRYLHLTQRGSRVSEATKKQLRRIFDRFDDPYNAVAGCELAVTFPSLLIMADRLCGAKGIENRSPFLDHRIIECAFSMPHELKLKGQRTKHILREAMRGIVPDRIIDLDEKSGLFTPINHWFAHDLSEWAARYQRRLEARGVEIPHGFDRGRYDRSAYFQVCLEVWHQLFLDAGGCVCAE